MFHCSISILTRDLHQVERDIITVTQARMRAPTLANLICLEELFARRERAVRDVESQVRCGA